MTDLHSHIIYGVDDGSKSLEESIALLKTFKEAGFDNVIMTPHYIEGSEFCALNDEKRKKLNKIREALKDNNIDINVYLGNEVYVNDHIVEGIKSDAISTLNGGKYVLFEIPFHNKVINLEDIIYEIKIQGYIPILAHPERYIYFQDNYELVDALKDEGLLFQANFASIVGYYGRRAKKLLKYMLKNQYIEYLGTDTHSINRNYTLENMKKIEKAFNKYAGKDYYQWIIKNGDNLISEK